MKNLIAWIVAIPFIMFLFMCGVAVQEILSEQQSGEYSFEYVNQNTMGSK